MENEDTQIRISKNVKKMLDGAKLVSQESYNDCIKRVLIGYQNYQKKLLITDMKKLSEKGKFVTWEEAKKELNL